jgi:hypothetical protein
LLPFKRLTKKYSLPSPYEGAEKITMIIGKVTNNINEPVKYIKGYGYDKTCILALECNLEPGEYIVFIDV